MSTIIPGSEEEGSGTDTGTVNPNSTRQLEDYNLKKKKFAIRAAVAGSIGLFTFIHLRLIIINHPSINKEIFNTCFLVAGHSRPLQVDCY